MAGDQAQEVRGEERLAVDMEIRFRYPEVFKGRMKDFCPSGIGAEVPVFVDVDSPVEIEIFEGRLLASGHVRWVRTADNLVRIGIKFRAGDREIIRQVQDWKGNIV